MSYTAFKRKKQCAKCPWKKSTNCATDIPGYKWAMEKELIKCQAPGLQGLRGTRVMACHESKEPRQYACVGWLVNQLGPGNNIALRLKAMDGRFAGLKVVGEQYESLEEMIAAHENECGD